jgi:hypothetical protein
MRDAGSPPPIDPRMRALIDAARGGHDPNELNRARVRRGVEVKLAAGIGLALGPAASAFAGTAVKLTLAVAAVGTVVGAGIYALPRRGDAPVRAAAHVASQHRPVAPIALGAAPAPVVAEPPAPVSPTEKLTASLPAPAPRRRVHAPPAPPVESASAIAEETALLGGANTALAHHDVARALALLNDYDHRSGAGVLAEERTVTGVLAFCAAGKLEAAAVEARRFRARWPRSPLTARIDGSCVGPARASGTTP